MVQLPKILYWKFISITDNDDYVTILLLLLCLFNDIMCVHVYTHILGEKSNGPGIHSELCMNTIINTNSLSFSIMTW